MIGHADIRINRKRCDSYLYFYSKFGVIDENSLYLY